MGHEAYLIGNSVHVQIIVEALALYKRHNVGIGLTCVVKGEKLGIVLIAQTHRQCARVHTCQLIGCKVKADALIAQRPYKTLRRFHKLLHGGFKAVKLHLGVFFLKSGFQNCAKLTHIGHDLAQSKLLSAGGIKVCRGEAERIVYTPGVVFGYENNGQGAAVGTHYVRIGVVEVVGGVFNLQLNICLHGA